MMINVPRFRLLGQLSSAPISIQRVQCRTVKGKPKERSKDTRRQRKNRKNYLNLDQAIDQSHDALSLARPFLVYQPPAHITPELADDLVLYKDGE